MSLDDAKRLLKIQFKANYFKEQGKAFLDGDVVNRNINKLLQATEDLVDLQSRAGRFDLKHTLEKMREAYDKGVPASKVMLDNKSLRGFSYNLVHGDYLFNKFVLDVLKENWTSSYLSGLLHSLLSNWAEFDTDERKLMSEFLTRRVESQNSRTADSLKRVLPYLKENGPFQLGYSFKNKGKSIYDCCSVFMLPRNRFTYSYFSDSLFGYYAGNTAVDFDALRNVLKRHNQVLATKKVLPNLIIAYDRKGKLPSELQKLAMDLIGDPFLAARWAPMKDMSREEEANLEKARVILTTAISAEFINIFFRVLADDQTRLDFWLKKTKYMTDFRVFGSSYSKSRMEGRVDTKILNKHFSVTTNNQDTCALVMVVKDFAIIEFTDVGALYVYQKSNNMYKAILEDRCRVDKMDDLKVPSMNKLVDDDGTYLHFSREGKMRHSGNWAYRLDSWFNRIVLK